MEYFSISPDEQWGKSHKHHLTADYLLGLPGVHCPVCDQTWANIGLSYPIIDLSSTSIAHPLVEPRLVDYDEYKSILSGVEQFVPKGLPILPGTCFGPLKGRLTGIFGDFVWQHLWDLLIKTDAYQKLISAGLRVPEAIAPLLQQKLRGQLLQLQIEPHGQLSPLSYVEPGLPICPQCGRDGRKLEKIVLMKESFSHDLDIFRIGNFTTYILVSCRFKDAVNELGLTNIKFKEVALD